MAIGSLRLAQLVRWWYARSLWAPETSACKYRGREVVRGLRWKWCTRATGEAQGLVSLCSRAEGQQSSGENAARRVGEEQCVGTLRGRAG